MLVLGRYSSGVRRPSAALGVPRASRSGPHDPCPDSVAWIACSGTCFSGVLRHPTVWSVGEPTCPAGRRPGPSRLYQRCLPHLVFHGTFRSRILHADSDEWEDAGEEHEQKSATPQARRPGDASPFDLRSARRIVPRGGRLAVTTRFHEQVAIRGRYLLRLIGAAPGSLVS